MEDLVRCDGGDCLLRYHCLRFTKRKYYTEEMYFEGVPCEDDLKECFFFWNENAEQLYKGIDRLNGLTN